ncbi:DUF1853 family protein [uncultured Polaribacter sp.]|uniref:DUF1853 family protein n=1 Tax=uncultured Polaribacter sp. TaxID=174711 RepID=UPI0026330A3A|nr:DUF1853 family protein [uncultured Polaribacter sp.]
MYSKNKVLQKRYEGFLQTNSLWKDKTVFDLKQFFIVPKITRIQVEINEKLRLGKYIERLVSFQLAQEKSIKILCENVQIQQEKRTLGELDCILQKETKIIHLEIVYKFYLYDSSVGETEIEHFIGPNRKDSLLEKLTKLKEKQLPLLYSTECKNYVNTINLSVSNLEQQVYFKAQLFIPLQEKIQLTNLNNACVCGFYIKKNELEIFKICKFFIPNKKDWIVIPHQKVDWINFEVFSVLLQEYYQKKYAPLCWIKQQNGEIIKVFLVWW